MTPGRRCRHTPAGMTLSGTLTLEANVQGQRGLQPSPLGWLSPSGGAAGIPKRLVATGPWPAEGRWLNHGVLWIKPGRRQALRCGFEWQPREGDRGVAPARPGGSRQHRGGHGLLDTWLSLPCGALPRAGSPMAQRWVWWTRRQPSDQAWGLLRGLHCHARMSGASADTHLEVPDHALGVAPGTRDTSRLQSRGSPEGALLGPLPLLRETGAWGQNAARGLTQVGVAPVTFR